MKASDPRALRVLLVAHFDRLSTRLDRSQHYRYQALAKHAGVTLFGPGIDGYRPGMSVRDSVAFPCGGVWPDIILHGMDLKESGIPLLVGLAEVPALTVLELQDSWAVPDQQVVFINQQRFDVGLLIVRHHIPFYEAHCPGPQFLWTPHAVNTEVFQNYHLPKEHDVLLYGNITPHTYPLRARLADLLTKSSLRFRLLSHPGYYPRQEAAPGPVIAGADLSRVINKSWLTISTSSIYRCVMMKYYEIAASYSLIAGDMPEEGRTIFGEDFLELRPEQSDKELLETLHSCLARKDCILEMTANAHRRIVTDYSTAAFAERLLKDLGALAEARHTRPAYGARIDNS